MITLSQSSLGGNTKTVMCAAVGPADYNYEETISTLRYANRAKNIKNKPVINEDPKDALLREYKQQIEELKAMLAAGGGGAPGALAPSAPPSAAAASAAPAATAPAPAAAVAEGDGERKATISFQDDASASAAEPSVAGAMSAAQQAAVERAVRQKLEQLEATMKQHNHQEPAASAGAGTGGDEGEGSVGDGERRAQAEVRRAEHELKQQKRRLKRQKQKQRRAEREANRANLELQEKDREISDMEYYYEQRLQEARGEVDDVVEESAREREGYLETIREQNREMGLLMKLCEQVVAPGQVEQLFARSYWDSDAQQWRIPKLKMRREYAALSLPGMGGDNANKIILVGDPAAGQREQQRASGGGMRGSAASSRGSSSSGGGARPSTKIGVDPREHGEIQRPETRRARERGNTSDAPDAVGALEWGPLVGDGDGDGSPRDGGESPRNGADPFDSGEDGGGLGYDAEIDAAAARPLRGDFTPMAKKKNASGVKLGSLKATPSVALQPTAAEAALAQSSAAPKPRAALAPLTGSAAPTPLKAGLAPLGGKPSLGSLGGGSTGRGGIGGASVRSAQKPLRSLAPLGGKPSLGNLGAPSSALSMSMPDPLRSSGGLAPLGGKPSLSSLSGSGGLSSSLGSSSFSGGRGLAPLGGKPSLGPLGGASLRALDAPMQRHGRLGKL